MINKYLLWKINRHKTKKERALKKANNKKSGGMMDLNGFVWNLLFKDNSSNAVKSEV